MTISSTFFAPVARTACLRATERKRMMFAAGCPPHQETLPLACVKRGFWLGAQVFWINPMAWAQQSLAINEFK